MALCVTGMVSSVAYKGAVTALRSLTGQTASEAALLRGEPALREALYRLDVVTLLETAGLVCESLGAAPSGTQLLSDDGPGGSLGATQPSAQTPPGAAVWRIIVGMRSTITDLQVALADARSRLEHYRQQWWYSWRSYDAGPEIRQIQMATAVLRDQLSMLHQVTGILGHRATG